MGRNDEGVEMRYWWVNHNKTWQHETEGSYLWSPMTETGGGRSHFYDNMRKAAPGDLVLSYATSFLGRVGVVTGHAFAAPRPPGHEGWQWNGDVGWLLPVQFRDLSIPVDPSTLLETNRDLYPKKYSPYLADHRKGSQKAYFSEISKALFLSLVGDVSGPTITDSDEDTARDTCDDAIERHIVRDESLDQTVKKALIDARRGQGRFRAAVMRNAPYCRVTEIRDPSLLVASHIRPWRACETASDRLDGSNGLMLAPHVDKLFDIGLISFARSGEILISNQVSPQTLRALGIDQHLESPRDPFDDQQDRHLQFHRESVFLG